MENINILYIDDDFQPQLSQYLFPITITSFISVFISEG